MKAKLILIILIIAVILSSIFTLSAFSFLSASDNIENNFTIGTQYETTNAESTG